MKLSEVGEKGQKLLSEATVLVIGAGGLGCASLPWLVRAGVGRIIIIDPGTIDEPDLGRQLLYREAHLGQQKATVAAAELAAMNPDVEVLPIPMALDTTNITSLASKSNFILDGTDQLDARRVINSYSVSSGTPWVYGGAVGWVGSVLACSPEKPCWECVFGGEPAPPNCDAAGVIGPVVGWVGAVQASMVMRILLGEHLGGNLLTADLLHAKFRSIEVQRNPNCPVCR